jgi:hypothetical protein
MQHACWAGSERDVARRDCAFGDVSAPATIALVGDSHAEHWLGGLDPAGKVHGWRIDAYVMGGCPVADLRGLTTGVTARTYRDCDRYREAVLARLVEEKPSAVILSNFDSYIETEGAALREYRVRESAWAEGLRRTYARLARAGIGVIVLRGTPRVPFDVPACLSRRAARLPFATACTYEPDRGFTARARRAQDNAARGLDVRFVDMNDQICEAGICETSRGALVMFTDNNHLTATFARTLAGALGDRVDAALRGSGTPVPRTDTRAAASDLAARANPLRR